MVQGRPSSSLRQRAAAAHILKVTLIHCFHSITSFLTAVESHTVGIRPLLTMTAEYGDGNRQADHITNSVRITKTCGSWNNKTWSMNRDSVTWSACWWLTEVTQDVSSTLKMNTFTNVNHFGGSLIENLHSIASEAASYCWKKFAAINVHYKKWQNGPIKLSWCSEKLSSKCL